MKEMIDKGAIGQPLYLYFQRLKPGHYPQAGERLVVAGAARCFGGLLPVRRPAGERIGHGQAYLQKGIEDVVFANLKFADGRMAHIHVSWLDPHKIRKGHAGRLAEDGRVRRHGGQREDSRA